MIFKKKTKIVTESHEYCPAVWHAYCSISMVDSAVELSPYSVCVYLERATVFPATVSLGAGVVSDLAAHQVTGQPLLATQPHSMMYLQPTGQALPAYQVPCFVCLVMFCHIG